MQAFERDGKSQVTANSAYTQGADELLNMEHVAVVFGGFGSASRSWLAIEGTGHSTIDGHTLHWQHNDVLCAPTHCVPQHTNASAQSPAFLIQVDDAPMQRRLGFHEARRTPETGDAG